MVSWALLWIEQVVEHLKNIEYGPRFFYVLMKKCMNRENIKSLKIAALGNFPYRSSLPWYRWSPTLRLYAKLCVLAVEEVDGVLDKKKRMPLGDILFFLFVN